MRVSRWLLGWAFLAGIAPTVRAEEDPPLPPPRHEPGVLGDPAPGAGGGPSPPPVAAPPPYPAPPRPPDELDRAAAGVVAPPPITTAPPRPGPGLLDDATAVRLTVDRRVGRYKTFVVDETTLALVMVGNPRILSDGLDVKARTIVVWFDRSEIDLGAFAGASPVAGLGGASKALAERRPAAGPGASAGGAGSEVPGAVSVVPRALLGVYAEGGVDLLVQGMSFRALELYLDPRTSRALLVEPRLDTSMPVPGLEEPVPLQVRAKRARILAAGLATFDGAELASSQANDRLSLRVRTLTIEEWGQAQAGEPLFMGFRGAESLHFAALGIEARGERLPLGYWPDASFGGEKGLDEFPFRVRNVTLSKRSSFGWYGFVELGGKEGPPGDRWFDWTVAPGYYAKRGPALETRTAWKRPDVSGALRTFYVYDRTGEDRNGYDAGEGSRGFVEVENRWEPSPRWRVDTELNWFSDRGVNDEYFQYDLYTHKDRETYARVRWMEGGHALTGTYGGHLRPYLSESLQQPELEYWGESTPLLPRANLPGGLGLDLSSEARAGWMSREWSDELEPFVDDYAAFRTHVRERLYAPFNVGDVRCSVFSGPVWTGYYDRTDGGEDLSRGALEAGARANLQLSRDWAVVGGPCALDGLRHVIDLDAGFYSRFLGDDDLEDVPIFDRIDVEEDRNEVTFEVRSRWETRRAIGKRRMNVPVADLRLRASWWPDGIGPYLRRGPGQAEAWALAEVVPQTVWITGTGLLSFEGPTLERSSLGLLAVPREDLNLALGLRQVQDELLAPWINVYWRWNPKWAATLGGIQDVRHGDTFNYRVGLLRFSPDHAFSFGFTLQDGGRDVGVFFDFVPAIGGEPVRRPFAPRDTIDLVP